MLAEMISEPGRLYSNPIWLVPASAITLIDTDAGETFGAATRVLAQAAAVIAILYVIWRFATFVWNYASKQQVEVGLLPYWMRQLIAGWALIFSILAFVPVNTHPWYWAWPVVPIALMVVLDSSDDGSRRPPHRWFVPWLVLTAVLTLVYHTRIVHT